MNDPNNRKVLKHVKVYNWVKGLIARNKYQVGEQIPTETEIAELFGFNRMTVRKALDALVADGLITRIQGKGTFITDPTFPQLTYSLDTIISFESIANIAQFKSSYTVIDQSVLIPAENIVKALLLKNNEKAIYTKRLIRGDGIPLLIERSYFPYPEFNFIMGMDLNQPAIFKSILNVKPDIVLHHSTQTLTSGLLSTSEKKLLEYAPETDFPCMRQMNIIFDANGVPVLLFSATFPGDKFQFVVNSGQYMAEFR